MKKNFLFYLLCIGITLAGCSDDNDPKIPFQLVTEGVEGLSGNTLNVLGYEDKTIEIPLKGVADNVTAKVSYDSANESEDGWCEADAINSIAKSGNNSWKAVVKVKGYDKNKERKASLTLTSGDEKITLGIVQQGAPMPGLLKFAAEQAEGFKDGNFTLESAAPASFDIVVTGITEGLDAEVREKDKDWLSAVAAEADGKVTVSVTGYRGYEDRIGFITIKSGIDELLLQVTQTAVAGKTEMIVVCEGQFTKGTSAISAIRYNGEVEWDVFRDVNNMPLGDVAHGMTYIDGKYFVVLNNSKQIKVVEPETFKLLGTIDYVERASPRFIAPINDKEAVVSDLYTQLTIVNYKDYSVVKHINLAKSETGKPLSQIEKMVRVGDKLFCASTGSAGMWVFDVNNITSTSMRIIDGVQFEKTAKMIVDKNGKLWVLSSTQLFCIDPDKEKIDYTFDLPIVPRTSDEYTAGCITGTVSYNRMDADRTKGKLYFLLRKLVTKGETASQDVKISTVYSFDVGTKELKPYTELPGLGMMYGMGVSPDGEVYLCDCMDYTAQRGYVRNYKNNVLVSSKMVGVYPRMIYFTEYDK